MAAAVTDAGPEGLVERDGALATLARVRDAALASGQGRCVLVRGEAGVGKSAVLAAFTGSLPTGGPDAATVLTAGCEPWFTPRPLGPLVDLAHRWPAPVTTALHEGRIWNGLFPTLLAHLGGLRPRPVLVIEDLHWADTATLDFVRFAGRRLREAPILLLLSHRSDEPAAAPALRHALGELPAATTTRLALEPLSADAVRALAQGRGRSARGLHAATAGNPFHVIESLASPPGGKLPPTVAEAVLARVSRLSVATRELAEWLSLFPGGVDRETLDRLALDDGDAIDDGVRHGLFILTDERRLGYRHELARLAVSQAVMPARRAARHARIFATFPPDADGDALARRIHHAEGAGLDGPVTMLAPLAARHAARHGAHREAARLYGLALRGCPSSDTGRRSALLGARARACALSGQFTEAIAVLDEALSLHRAADDRLAECSTLLWLARMHGWNDSLERALDCAHRAVACFESPDTDTDTDTDTATLGERASANAALAQLQLAAGRVDDALAAGEVAVRLAQGAGNAAALSVGLGTTASARLRRADDPDAWRQLERSLEIASHAGLEAETALAHANRLSIDLLHRRYAQALAGADRSLAFCEARGLELFAARLRLRRAFALVQAGHWSQASEALVDLAESPPDSALERSTLDFVAALLDLRRGSPRALHLEAACTALQAHGERIWFASIAAARAEAAWLAGDDEVVVRLAASALAAAMAADDPWRVVELAAWISRAGGALPDALARSTSVRALVAPWVDLARRTPQWLEISGRAREAAEAWAGLGCPYEQAMALGTSGESGLVREARERFERLGAAPAVARLDRLRPPLRSRWGPQPRTRRDPLGLTARERQVCDRLLTGQSNAAIARALCRSIRTVEHHVAAVLGKAGVHSRAELIARLSSGHEPGTIRG